MIYMEKTAVTKTDQNLNTESKLSKCFDLVFN